ncbi:MAG TPA: NUDIX domain-containing protein [Thermoflexia bacterium]|nr:NUDIX domain-containing protein [Thermoflexia bacterium]
MQLPEELNDATRYTVIPRTLVFLTRGTEVLLLRGAPDKRLWAGKYNGLGGHIELGEEPRRAARREVQEEAGLDVAELTLRAVIQVTLPEPPGVMLFVFVGAAPVAQPRSSPEGTPVWVQRQELTEYPLVEDLYELLPRVLAPGEIIFGEYLLTEDRTEYRFAV